MINFEMEKNEKVEVIIDMNNWVYVNSEKGNGWIEIDSISKEEENKNDTPKEEQKEEPKKVTSKKGYVDADTINFRKKPDSSSEAIDILARNAEVTIIGEDGSWYKVTYKNKTGYLLKKYVSDKKTQTSRSSTSRTETKVVEEKTSTSVPSNPKGQDIANYAKQFVGSKYVYGASNPSRGFDCSGLTMYVYSKFGVKLPHSSSGQTGSGKKVSKSELQPGDLVFFTNFRTGKGIGHVGIYIGGNKFVHASNEKTGVITSSLSGSSYARRYVTAVRVIK